MKVRFSALLLGVALLAGCQTIGGTDPEKEEQFAAACVRAGHPRGTVRHQECVAKSIRVGASAVPVHLRLCHQNAGTVECY